MSATDARWLRVNELFHAALGRSPAERDAFLAAECATDSRLHLEVRSLIAAHGSNIASSIVTPGTRLGDYEVTGFLAAGGMGQVYRARDTKLGRNVALKILPPAFVSDPDRRARFEREARLLAALNHSNIATIYGFVEQEGISALALELVEGETLAERIARGKLPVDEALRIAKQIAEALEAAHEQGIVHRDLKPANIKLTRDGAVKVLDFGLAKLTEPVGGGQSAVGSVVTVAGTMTGAHVLIGTPAYMSPEQARGDQVDKRTDTWAFGCVLYEMLAGKSAFAGDNLADILATVLRGEPDWKALDGTVGVLKLVRRCLHKDPKRRFHSAADVQLDIEDALLGITDVPSSPTKSTVKVRAFWTLALTAVIGAMVGTAALGVYLWRTTPAASARTITRFAYALAEGQAFSNTNRPSIAISPDGERIVYVADLRLYLRSLSEEEARPMAGTETAVGPIFSPDGRFVAFWGADRTLKKIGIDSATAVTLCPAEAPYGMSWDADGIVFGEPSVGIMRVSSSGGKPQVLIPTNRDELIYGPQLLPGGNFVLFTRAKAADGDAAWDKAQIVVQSIRTGEQKTLIERGSAARYVPTGHLVYIAGGTLLGVRFDVRRLETVGGPTPIVDGVRRSPTGAAHFSFSNNGSLIYLSGPSTTAAGFRARTIAVIDRNGTVERLKLPPGPYEVPRVSPDGTRIAFGSNDAKEANIWVYERGGVAAPRRLTFSGRNRFPMWSSDGQRVAFQSDREGDSGIFWQRADGTAAAERLTMPGPGESHVPNAWSPDGSHFLFTVVKGTAASLWIWSMRDKSSTLFGGVQSLLPPNGVFSPDGRWVAYQSGQVFNNSVYVQPYPATGAKYQVSKGNAHAPIWSPDGTELFYQPARERPVVVRVTTRPTFALGDPAVQPTAWGDGGPTIIRDRDVTPDGKLVNVVPFEPSVRGPQIQFVLNWFDELNRLVPAN